MADNILLETLASNLPLGVCILDAEYRVLYWNRFFSDRLEIKTEEVMGKSLLTLFPKQASYLKKKIQSVFVLKNASFSYWEHKPHVFDFSSSRPVTGEESKMFQNIEFFPLQSDSTGVKTLCMVVQDVTELASYYQSQKALSVQLEAEHAEMLALNKKLEAAQNQLLQAEKMAAIGQLAAGVAHEINNPIGFVSSNLQTLQDYANKLLKLVEFYGKLAAKLSEPKLKLLEQDMLQRQQYEFIQSDMPELICESIDGVARVSSIVKNLKAFSHVDNSEWQYADLIEGLENTIKIANNQLKYKVDIHRDYPQALPQLYCQPMQLNQVFLNLLINAAQAIEEKGDIFVTVTFCESNIIFTFRDTGIGIDKKNLHKIFEPFFTTKPVGTGTGLGLSLSYSILKKHRGDIEVESEKGKGTVFTLTLPILSPEQLQPDDTGKIQQG